MPDIQEVLVRESGNPQYRIVVERGASLSGPHAAEVDRLPDGVVIRLAARLSDSECDQAIAHEAAHILLEYRWLEPPASMNLQCDPLNVREIGNAISHPFVVDLLATEFSIASDLHFQERGANIDQFETYVPSASASGDETLFLGLVLFDMARARSDLAARVNAIANSNGGVQAVFASAQRWLGGITPATDRPDQTRAVRAFLAEVP